MTPTRSSRLQHHREVPRRPIQLLAAAVGAVFLLVGALGFVPGITANYDELSFAGHHAGALLLGVFAVSVLHNLVHVAFGVAGLLMSGTARQAAIYLVGGGAIYLVLWLYGIAIDHDSAANFVPVNTADNWLHLGLGAGMVTLGLVSRRAG
ncbi:membrane protein [Lentzea sp. NBRC 105346]|uniref:DUF4383 domain-containing protein n=1 Tax=Lentzea sp. NBRC 105346 TaxID=3032205 RepID=UPI0024A10C29|nr:DUF4383 domain-containing protein [Lentzea sp. NBRC 105346]GLZ32039.1 membrane protein [Lentzea sp. NBRC 105346]